jgi:hypothetical protein
MNPALFVILRYIIDTDRIWEIPFCSARNQKLTMLRLPGGPRLARLI